MATPVDRLVKFGMQARRDLIVDYGVEENLADAFVTTNQEALVLALDESDRRFEKTIRESNQRFEESNRRYEEARRESNRRFEESRRESNRRFEESRRESNRRFEEARRESDLRFEESNRRFAEIRADIKQEFGKVYERFDKVDQRIDGIDDRLKGVENKVKNFKLELTIASFVTAGLVAGMLVGLDKLLEIL